MKKYFAFAVAAALGLAIWSGLFALWVMRCVAFVVLMLLHPVAGFVCGVGAFASLVALAIAYVIAPEMPHLLWVCAGCGMGLTTLGIFYDWIVLALNPGPFPMVVIR